MASPAQMDRDRQQLNFSNRPRVSSFNIPSSKKTNDSASFANYMPPKKTNDSASFANYLPPVDNSNNNNNSGIEAFNFNTAGGGSGAGTPSVAQSMLGDYYGKALKYMTPSELDDQIAKAQSYGRGIDLTQFKNNLDKFDAFQNMDGNVLKYENEDGSFTNYLNVSDPMITANAPTLAQLMGDIGGGIGDMMGAGADFIMGGGTIGKVLSGLKDKFAQGKNFVGDMMNPGDIRGRVDALSPEQQRMYYQLLPNMTYQQAFEQASGQAFARGGISSLN